MTAGDTGTDSVTLTPLLWRRRGAWFWLSAMAVTLIAEVRASAPPWVLVLLTASMLVLLDPFAITLIITPDQVSYRRRRLLPRTVIWRHAPMAAVCSIHVRPREVTFTGISQEPLLQIPSGWTTHQYREMSARLGVPLYDHRVKLAWQEPRPKVRSKPRPRA
jgi:hypothetical protein